MKDKQGQQLLRSVLYRWIIPSLVGLGTAVAFLFPGEIVGACCAWIAVYGWCWIAEQESKNSIVRSFYLASVICHFVGFYWLPHTLEYFGGFPLWLAGVLFVLFCLSSSLQFAFCGYLYRYLAQTTLQKWCLALPFAWLASEFLVPRLFPWSLAHSQLPLRSFSGLAEYVGVYPLSALMLYWGQGGMRVLRGRHQRLGKTAFCVWLLSFLLVVFGWRRSAEVEHMLAGLSHIRLGLIQGNLEAKQRGDQRYFDVNINRYAELSKKAQRDQAAILIWPEAVYPRPVPVELPNITHTAYDLYPGRTVPIIYGTLAYEKIGPRLEGQEPSEDDINFYNSAFAVDLLGKVVGHYHKKVLMPFGEYVPMSSIFPKLKELLPQTGDFAAGTLTDPLRLETAGRSGQGMATEEQTPAQKVIGLFSLLICYEDLVPRLSRESVLRGGTVLVNLTNDAWYGDTHAPFQHHLLASWRAIETRRYLVRSTNTGFTGIVNPVGETIAQLPIFEEGYLVTEVGLNNAKTSYVQYGDLCSWLLLCFGGVVGLISKRACKHTTH